MKTNTKQTIKVISIYTAAIIATIVLAKVCWATASLVADPVEYEPVIQVNVPKIVKEEVNIREWVLNAVKEAGLNPKEADKIISCESKWNPDAHQVNWDNRAGVDRGLWQINSFAHKDISNACSYDFKCSTLAAIKIYKSRGNWSAWTCSKILTN